MFAEKRAFQTENMLALLQNKKSYVRTRAFLLCCAQARWSETGQMEKILSQMLPLLDDDKPTVVRQCLGALQSVAAQRPELCGMISAGLMTMDLLKYKDSMAPLIAKDRDALQMLIETQKEEKK